MIGTGSFWHKFPMTALQDSTQHIQLVLAIKPFSTFLLFIWRRLWVILYKKYMWGTPTKQWTRVTFWIKQVFGSIVRSTLSALIWFQKSSSYSYFLKYDHLCIIRLSIFSGSVILRNWPLKFPIPIIMNLTGCRKCRVFLWENVWKSVRNYMVVIENILRFAKTNKQNWQTRFFFFHPYANFNCPYRKIGLFHLFLGLLECITFFLQWKTQALTVILGRAMFKGISWNDKLNGILSVTSLVRFMLQDTHWCKRYYKPVQSFCY